MPSLYHTHTYAFRAYPRTYATSVLLNFNARSTSGSRSIFLQREEGRREISDSFNFKLALEFALSVRDNEDEGGHPVRTYIRRDFAKP